MNYSSCNNNLIGNTSRTSNNSNYGIYLLSSSNKSALTSNTASNNSHGIRLRISSNNIVYFYNNYFDNTQNAYDNGLNIWNITKTPGLNIVGGSYLGGNYWCDYAVEEDTYGDGLGNTFIPHNPDGNILNGGDWLPLVKAEAQPGRWDINEDCTES